MKKIIAFAILPITIGFLIGCDAQVQSVSGTKMTTVGRVATGSDGLTIEQHNVTERIEMDNKVGAIKHLYVVSAYSGQVLIYSTVKGKVTSSGKRLTPDRVDGPNNFKFRVGMHEFYTDQVLGEDGTYGSSIEYLYWWDSRGVYHQHYVSGGQIVHVSDQPLVVKGIVINMELTTQPEGQK